MQTTLALRPIGPNDYAVIDDDHRVGRIRHAAERTNDVWMWNVTVLIPSPPYGSSRNSTRPRAAFRDAWTAFKAQVGPEWLARAFETRDNANSKGKK